MIRPEGMHGAAFGAGVDGDGRDSPQARASISRQLGIPQVWATVAQVHGDVVIEARIPGAQGEGDAMYTSIPDLPIAIATADCVPVVLEGADVVAVVHAGWRGMALGVIKGLRSAIAASGLGLERAAIGPAIGPCCYEVGPEVVEKLAAFESKTDSGSQSVDLWAAARDQLQGLDIWQSQECTMSDTRYHSHRRDATARRQMTLAWLPSA